MTRHAKDVGNHFKVVCKSTEPATNPVKRQDAKQPMMYAEDSKELDMVNTYTDGHSCMFAYIHTYLDGNMQAYTWAYLATFIHKHLCMSAYIQTYTSIQYIPTYILRCVYITLPFFHLNVVNCQETKMNVHRKGGDDWYNATEWVWYSIWWTGLGTFSAWHQW